MIPFVSWFSRLGTGLTGLFQKAALSAAKDAARGQVGRDEFDSYPARAARYTLNWALYENTAYDNIHRYAHQHKVDYSLYPAIRNVMNPATREGDFWATHLYGGNLDEAAGDGKIVKSAIPIEEATDPQRAGISKLWVDSRWGQSKDVYAGLGAKLGDVVLKVEDDPTLGRMCLRVVDPRDLTDYREGPDGTCVGYQIERWVRDPRPAATLQSAAELAVPKVLYREVAVARPEGGVAYYTFLESQPWGWGGRPAQWVEDYPQVPLFLTAHIKLMPDVPFGVAGIWPVLSKIRELDDLASRLSDFVAKSIDAPWLLAGVSSTSRAVIPREARTAGNPDPKKEAVPTLYGGPEARAQALIAPLDFPGVLKYMDMIQEEIKDDLPETRKDIESAIGDASGKALTVARQRTEARAQSIRAGYDFTLTRAMKLALAIGEARGYEGYAGVGDADAQAWRIGHRSVFETAPMDELEYQEKFWAVAESADRAGCPLPAFLASVGKDEEFIARIVEAQDEYMEKGLEVGRTKAQAPVNSEAQAEAVQSPNGAVK